VSMYQIASARRRAISIRAILAPRWRPRRALVCTLWSAKTGCRQAWTRRIEAAQLASELEEPVLEALRGASDPLARADLLACTGMPDCAWEPTIRRLIERGAVAREGVKRGAKYRLGEAAS